jgi:hypothetical protein
MSFRPEPEPERQRRRSGEPARFAEAPSEAEGEAEGNLLFAGATVEERRFQRPALSEFEWAA